MSKTRQILISLSVMLLLILFWWGATQLHWVSSLYLPKPEYVLQRFFNILQHGYLDQSLYTHIWASITRVALALLIACVIGIPLGILMGVYQYVHAALDPIIEFYRPVPPLAYLPLIVIWFGIGELSKVLLISLAIFAPVVIATCNGIRSISKHKIQAAQSLGASPAQLIRFIILPATLPYILTGIRIGLGVGWSTLVAAELIAASEGLGFVIQSASQFLLTDVVIVGILLIATIAFTIEIGLRSLQRKLVPWADKIFD